MTVGQSAAASLRVPTGASRARRAPAGAPVPRTIAATAALVLAPVLGVGAVVQWQLDTPPVLALVASVLAVALPLRRILPVPVAAAAALLLCVMVWLTGLLVLGLSGLTLPLHPALALGVLLLPCLAWVAEFVPAVRRTSPPPGAASAGCARVHALAAGTGGVVMVLAVVVAGLLHRYGDVAWALGGDARNQLLVSRGIIELGGLEGTALSSFPGLSNGMLSLLIDTRHRTSIEADDVLLLDFRGLARLALLSIVAWCAAAAGLLAVLGDLTRRRQGVALAVASLVPLTGVGIGVALCDGFHSSLFSLPLLTTALLVACWAVRARPEGAAGFVTCAALGAALPVAATSWSPLLPIVGLLVLPAVLVVALTGDRRWGIAGFLVASVQALAAALLLLPLLQSGKTSSVAAGGSITPPAPVVFVLVPLLVAAIALSGLRGLQPRTFLPYATGTVGAALVVGYAVSQQPGTLWNYYPAKLSWLWILAALPLLLAPAVHHPAVAGERPGRDRRQGLIVVCLLSVATLALASSFGRISSPLLFVPRFAGLGSGAATPGGTNSVLDGWAQPDADTVAEVLELGDEDQRSVFWGFRDPGEDRLGNFWLSAYEPLAKIDGTVPLSPFAGWAYTYVYDAANLTRLCEILAADPTRVVVTHDPTLVAGVGQQCAVPPSRVDVEPPFTAPAAP